MGVERLEARERKGRGSNWGGGGGGGGGARGGGGGVGFFWGGEGVREKREGGDEN